MKKFLTAFILLPTLILVLPILAALRFPRLRTVPAAAVADYPVPEEYYPY